MRPGIGLELVHGNQAKNKMRPGKGLELLCMAKNRGINIRPGKFMVIET